MNIGVPAITSRKVKYIIRLLNLKKIVKKI
jgi:hypothetical protein